MKITMLGYTKSGKTCYMLGMYSFMSIGLNGFTVSATDLDTDLELTDKWDALVCGQGEERWPRGNDANIYTYSFDFNYAAKQIMDFDWIDYRGGALRDKSSQADVQELLKYVKESACLFLCISGEFLTKEIVDVSGNVDYGARQRIATQLKITPMTNIITDIQKKLNPTNAKPFPIAIVVTKYDQCMARGKDAVVRDVKQLFEPFFQPNSGLLTMICPVSLGKDLSENLNTGEINPINVHLPVAFAIYAKLRENALNAKAYRDEISRGINADKGRNWFIRWVNSEEMANKEAKLKELEGQFEVIQSKMERLTEELQKVPLFLGDKEVKVDVSI